MIFLVNKKLCGILNTDERINIFIIILYILILVTRVCGEVCGFFFSYNAFIHLSERKCIIVCCRRRQNGSKIHMMLCDRENPTKNQNISQKMENFCHFCFIYILTSLNIKNEYDGKDNINNNIIITGAWGMEHQELIIGLAQFYNCTNEIPSTITSISFPPDFFLFHLLVSHF